MKLFRNIVKQLYFHNKERKAIIILLSSIFILYVIQFYIADKKYHVQKEMISRINYVTQEVRSTEKSKSTKQKKWKKPIKKYKPKPLILTSFNPNLSSKSELIEMGLPYFGVLNLLKYREKGGVFKIKNDLQKIYGLDTVYRKIEPWIALPDTIEYIAKDQPVFQEITKPDDNTYEPKKYVQKILDVNTASIEDFKALKGIGDVLSDRIVKYRDRLGGFVSIEQISDVYFLPDSVFTMNKPYLKIENDSIRKIHLNTADFTRLNKHPLISYKQAQLILAYRKQHEGYKQIEEIQNIKAFDHGFVEKILPYLTL